MIFTLLIVSAITLAVQLVGQWPWWTYLIFCFILGVFLPFKKWGVPAFPSGCISGCMVWLGATLFFNGYYPGEIMGAVSGLLKLPYVVLFMLIGAIGAVLSGLALYSGFLLRRGRTGNDLTEMKI